MNGLLGAVDGLIMTLRDNDSFTLTAFSSNSSNLLNLGWFPAKGQPNLKPLIEAQISLFELIIDLMETELDFFTDQHVEKLVNETLNLLGFSSKSSSRDGLTVVAMQFLTMVKGSHPHVLFERDDFLQHLSRFIVIPNLMLRKEHEELFNLDYLEFIDKDMEGSGLDRRRSLACELINVTDHRYKSKVLEMVLSQISNCLEMYNQDPVTLWKHKECTISLVVSLAEKGSDGSALTNNLVEVENFFSMFIIPELRNQDINGLSMLKAGALKFFIVFRNQILKPTAMTLIPDVVRLLKSDSNVVHSYAATCVEKLLRIKGDGAYTAADICPHLVELTCNLFKALEKKDSEENKYVMACIMRVLGVADISDELALRCLSWLALVFDRVCEHPKNSVFNCYLFEAVAVFLRRACEKRCSLVQKFEEHLFPSLLKILDQNVVEFVPYALQLLSQLVELNNAPISLSCMKVFSVLMSSDSSGRPESVHRARAQLLQSFFEKAPHLYTKEMWLDQFLLIVNELVRSRKSGELFYVLKTIIENFEYNVIEPHMKHIWNMIFWRVSIQKTEKLRKSLVIFMSLFLVKYGSDNLVLSSNAAEPGMFLTVIESIWIPTLKLIEGPIKIKLTSVASTRLIFDSSFLDTTTCEHWGMMLDSIVSLLSLPEQDNVEKEVEVKNFEETVGCYSKYPRLYNAMKKEKDPLGDIKDAKQYLVALLESRISLSPRKYHQLIIENLARANQAALLQFCDSSIGILFTEHGT